MTLASCCYCAWFGIVAAVAQRSAIVRKGSSTRCLALLMHPQRRHYHSTPAPIACPPPPWSHPCWKLALLESHPAPTTSHNQTILSYFATTTNKTNTTLLFPSKSQARRAIQHGEILVLSPGSKEPNMEDSIAIAHILASTRPNTVVTPQHAIYKITRLPDKDCYPVATTKYVPPPALLLSSQTRTSFVVIYQDHHLAVVSKPENVTTIGTTSNRRNDLQSLLPFVLSPPPHVTTGKNHNTKQMLPRPVHRLDRGTSGLVLVAKTRSILRALSAMFAQRAIHKSYTAVVFGVPKGNNQDDWNFIDYPIMGKSAMTYWRLVTTNGVFSQLECHPTTGRNHQLRRHLAYCLGTPIVGDPKYDLVRQKEQPRRDDLPSWTPSEIKSYRSQGLFLCCHQLEFDYPTGTGDAEHTVKYPQEMTGPGYSYSLWRDSRAEQGQEDDTCSSSSNNNKIEGTLKLRITMDLPTKMKEIFVET